VAGKLWDNTLVSDAGLAPRPRVECGGRAVGDGSGYGWTALAQTALDPGVVTAKEHI